MKSLFVLSPNPVITKRNIRCVNTYILNDGSSLIAFRDNMNANYVRRTIAKNNYIVNVPIELLDSYCSHNKIREISIVKSIYCDINNKSERLLIEN